MATYVNIGMNRYENGKIYKITDIGYNKAYVGSTCESLSKRIERHRAKNTVFTKQEKQIKICQCLKYLMNLVLKIVRLS